MNNVFKLAGQCLAESDVQQKINLSLLSANKITINSISTKEKNKKDIEVGWPNKPKLVAPYKLPKRKLTTLEGQAAMIHSFAHIEFNAINLAWDIICRYQDMPAEFYRDWADVAGEEAKHFSLLNDRLKQLGFCYGDFDAHDGLWQMAIETADDILVRLAVIPRIYEARGLDVTPDLINRFKEIKDTETVSILEVIYKDEIGHVKIGTKWFRYVCKQRELNTEEVFASIFSKYSPAINNKINRAARIEAGFTDRELETIT